jgi:phenylacetate-CoA ligase
MPLIRYEVGDIAEWGEPCDCGIRLPVIKHILGRTRHLVTHPDGRENFVLIYARDFEAIPNLQAYRFTLHQKSIVDAQLKAGARSAEIDRLVTERVQRAVGYPYEVRIRYVDEINWHSTWKQELFGVSESPPPPVEPVDA